MPDTRVRPLRVLLHILEYPPLFAGHAIHLHRLAPALQAAGASVEVLTGDFGRLARHEIIDGIRVHRIPHHPKRRYWEHRSALRSSLALLRRRKRFDVLHLNGFSDPVGIIASTARLLRKGVVLQLVLLGTDDPETILSRYRFPALRRWALSRAHRIICISPPLRESAVRAGLPPDRVVFVPQGVDTDRFRPPRPDERASIRAGMGFDPHDPVVVSVGAIIARKGIDVLLEAWVSVQERVPAATLVLVGPDQFSGDDPDTPALDEFVRKVKAFASSRRLRVHFAGRQEQVERYLQAADVFVLASRQEGFGAVIIEALACGLPAVVTPMDGIGAVTVQHGQNGFIADGPEAIADAIVRLLHSPALAAGFAQAARRSAELQFDSRNVARSYVHFYEEAFRAARG
ncbi:MAG: glycosyltransferase family 4 protein [Armatimonadota bacterium]|nr:glycosyltransferase family 4 protein [Armatimonadota bacterium]